MLNPRAAQIGIDKLDVQENIDKRPSEIYSFFSLDVHQLLIPFKYMRLSGLIHIVRVVNFNYLVSVLFLAEYSSHSFEYITHVRHEFPTLKSTFFLTPHFIRPPHDALKKSARKHGIRNRST